MNLDCHPEPARRSPANESESKDPETVAITIARQGILSNKFIALVFALAMISALYAGESTRFVSTSPAAPIKLRPGQSATAEFRFHVADGYHINSSKPKSELLIPTQLKLQPPPLPLAIKDFQYPAGKDLTLSFDPTEHLSVYSGDFSVHAQLAAARGAAPGHYQLAGELRYQACSDRACYPPKKLPVNLEVELLPEK